MFAEYQSETMRFNAVSKDWRVLKYAQCQSADTCIAAIKQSLESFKYIICNKRNYLEVLKFLISNNQKDEKILNKIIKRYHDKEFKDIYTKHNLWKYVDFSKLKKLDDKYTMVL